MDTSIKPFKISVPDQVIQDLNQRLDNARLPEKELVTDLSQGLPLEQLRRLIDYWRNEYDWRRCESQLNAYPQFTTNIDGLDIHFLHIQSEHTGAMPLLLTHGWPGSVVEFLKIIEPLTKPELHGGDAKDAFHLVIPSLPGFGFSSKPEQPGWGVERIAKAWSELMKNWVTANTSLKGVTGVLL